MHIREGKELPGQAWQAPGRSGRRGETVAAVDHLLVVAGRQKVVFVLQLPLPKHPAVKALALGLLPGGRIRTAMSLSLSFHVGLELLHLQAQLLKPGSHLLEAAVLLAVTGGGRGRGGLQIALSRTGGGNGRQGCGNCQKSQEGEATGGTEGGGRAIFHGYFLG